MRLASAIAFLMLVHAGDEMCDHGSCGAMERIDLKATEKGYDDLAKVAAGVIGEIHPRLEDGPYDAGLPACRRGTRT